ncbi:hypothetical protein L1887_05825 [Cichorium endivia]|nr:hypothetical protein L1887_05825 [Cichorium endivia]
MVTMSLKLLKEFQEAMGKENLSMECHKGNSWFLSICLITKWTLKDVEINMTCDGTKGKPKLVNYNHHHPSFVEEHMWFNGKGCKCCSRKKNTNEKPRVSQNQTKGGDVSTLVWVISSRAAQTTTNKQWLLMALHEGKQQA